ncbi:MAG: ferredoxin, partial [Muribaculaceae bacterium]|nr:ferredoxin [Muribaculaceae bacterium]
MLKKLRVVLAVIFIVCLTALFVDFTGSAIGPLGWMAKAQFWPAVLSFNIISLVLLILLTFVAGRIYCSV